MKGRWSRDDLWRCVETKVTLKGKEQALGRSEGGPKTETRKEQHERPTGRIRGREGKAERKNKE